MVIKKKEKKQKIEKKSGTAQNRCTYKHVWLKIMVTIDIYTAEQQILVCIEFLLRFVYSSQLPLKVPTLHQSWGRAHVMAFHLTALMD